MKKLIMALSIAVYTIACVNFISSTDATAAFPIAEKTVVANAPASSANQADVVTTASAEQQQMKAEAKKTTKSKAGLKGKSQLVALLLCFFVGGLGIHRFYLGYTWQGVVQLLTAGGCGVWALIDFIRIIIGDLGPKGGSYEKTL